MRSLTPAGLALAVALSLAGTAPAQQRPPKVLIDEGGVRVGFPNPSDGSGFKTGFWAPVYVQLTAPGPDRVTRADGDIVVSTTDSDDMENVYRVPLPPMEPKEQTTVLTYVRPGATGSEITVTIKANDGRTLAYQRAGRGGFAPAPPGTFLYVTAGADSTPLRRALRPQKAAPAEGGVPQVEDVGEGGEDADALTTFSHVNQVHDLPTRWFGYDPVDVLILETGGNPSFVQQLLDDRANRKEALAEWVHRGGRLVISVGHNHQLVNALLEQLQVINCSVHGTVPKSGLDSVPRWANVNERFVPRPPRNKEQADRGEPVIELAKIDIQPRKNVQNLLDEVDQKTRERWPVIVQAPSGLGRVVLIDFDLDKGPFTDWEGQNRFWQKLNAELRPGQAGGKVQNNPNMAMGGMPGWDQAHSDVGSLMQDRLEAFTEVPVISFGWVALFILLYIVVVGPLDYLFLKKVVKRLELTWITFPTVVLVVSALAYVSAYYLKGNDLRINKVDLVDVVAELPDGDAAQPRLAQGTKAYGSTWFTVFSPRIQNYTIGVEPAAAAWVPEADKQAPANPHSAVVTWMGRPENSYGGTGRSAGSPSLFRRAYEYAPDAAGLKGVPIQVWSTKSFTASWQAALSEDRPLFQAELTRVTGRTGEQLTGTVTSQLPVELEDAVLLYRNTRYPLPPRGGRLPPGVPCKLDPPLAVGGPGNPQAALEEYFRDAQVITNLNPWAGNPRFREGNRMESAAPNMKSLMFGDKDSNGGHARNMTLRRLEESWRLNRPEEAVVVGRVPRAEDAAETVSLGGASPSRLWLGQLPDSGEQRPPLAGKLCQETYVRVFIPVATK
jgi:hypothetical protein